MKAWEVVVVVLVVVVGALAVVAGEADDSPGLQGLGVLLAVGAGVVAWRRHRRRSASGA